MQDLLDSLRVQVSHGLLTNLQVLLYASLFALEPWCRRRFPAGHFLARIVTNLSLAVLTFGFGVWLYTVLPWLSADHVDGMPVVLSVHAWPVVLGLPVFIVAYDLSLYGFHCLSHRWRWLWRVHQVHHSDLEVDVTTSYRHHPLELLYALIPRLFILVLLAPPLEYLLVYELGRVFIDPFSHADLALPQRLERLLRTVLITPDMHRIHHSAVKAETDSNFGVFLSVWDRLFGTFRWRSVEEQRTMALGLDYGRDRRSQSLWGTLLAPLTLPALNLAPGHEFLPSASVPASIRPDGRVNDGAERTGGQIAQRLVDQ